jgi:PAS domain S-box-containing protein
MIIRDISEQNRSQEALKESEEKYRHLVERAYVGIGIGQDGVLKYVNPSLAEMVGYGIEELIGKPFVDFFIPEEAPRILDRYNRRLAGEEVPPLCESAFQHKDGTRIEVELNAGMIIYQGRSADMVIVRDVTERKRAEESLKISEERFRIAAESSNDFIYEWDIQSGRLEWFDTAPEGLNSIFEEIPVTINAFAHYIHPDDYERVSEAVRRQVRDGQPYHEEYRLIGKKGNIVYIKTAGECLRNERGRAYKWIGVTSDITERKLAEEALVRAEEKYRNIVENAVEGIFQSTTDGKFITANAALANMLAYDSPEQLIESVEDSGTQLYSDPADRDRARKILAERGELKNFEAYVQRKDGKRIWVNLNARLVKDQKGKVLYYEGTAENITERKRAEALIEHNLQETRVRFKVSQALLGKETEDEVLDVLIKEAGISPQALVAILTLEKSEKGPMAVLRRISYFDSGLTQNVSSGTSFPASDFPILNQYLEGRSFVSENILEDQRVDPLVRDLIRRAGGKSFAAFPLKEGMEVLGVLLAVARKDQYIDQAKQHLFQTLADQGAAALQAARLRSQIRESQKRFQGLVETISDWIWEVDIEGVYSYVSPRVRDLLGYEPEELLGKSPYLHHPLGEEGAEKKSFGRLLTSRQPLRGQEIPCRHKKGHIVLFETNGDPFYDERGNFKGYRGINHDITQRKEAQEALAKAEEKYRAIVENAVEGIFQSTVDGRFLMVNRALAKFHGYPSPEEMMKEVIDIGVQLYVNSEERQKYRRILDEHGFVSGFETQLYTRDKKIKWGSLNVRAVKDSQGQLLHYEGTIEDITARKEAEEGQRKTMERLKKSLEGIIQAMALTVETRDPYTAGHQRRVTDLAQALARNMGLSEDRVEGVRMAGIVHDIGKIAIPAEILSKPTKLSDIEFKLIMAHPQISYDILKDIEFPWPLAQIVLQHHERLDGSGYPNGLSGNDICLEARILAVADVVEAISSHRPYRPAFSIETALEEITLKKGKLYHTDVVEACLRLFKERGYAFA